MNKIKYQKELKKILKDLEIDRDELKKRYEKWESPEWKKWFELHRIPKINCSEFKSTIVDVWDKENK